MYPLSRGGGLARAGGPPGAPPAPHSASHTPSVSLDGLARFILFPTALDMSFFRRFICSFSSSLSSALNVRHATSALAFFLAVMPRIVDWMRAAAAISVVKGERESALTNVPRFSPVTKYTWPSTVPECLPAGVKGE